MLNPISANNSIYFRNLKQNKPLIEKQDDEIPISKKGETLKLITATFLGGLAVAGKLIFELFNNGDFVLDIFADKAKKMSSGNPDVVKNDDFLNKAKEQVKEELKNKSVLRAVGAFTGLVAAFFAGFALIYTAYNAPKIAYEAKVNTFKKSKEMDVYVKSNEVEKELYSQLDEKAQSSSPEEKMQLKEQYLKLKNAKNETPDFVNLKLKS